MDPIRIGFDVYPRFAKIQLHDTGFSYLVFVNWEIDSLSPILLPDDWAHATQSSGNKMVW